MKPLETDEDISELLRAAKALGVVSAWHGLGLFQALAKGPKRITELPGNRRAVELTLPVIKHLGLVVGDDERIALSPAARRLLDAGQMPTEQNLRFLESTARTLDILRDGGPVDATDGGVKRHDPEHTRAFLDMLDRRSVESAQLTFDWISPKMPPGGLMLDVGGGHGRYARTFADAGYQATLLDFPHVIDYARKKHQDSIRYIPGDFHDVSELGGPYDLIFLSNIVHGEPNDNNARLMTKLAKALVPKGRIVIKDMFVDSHGRDPANAVFFNLTMLFYTQGGRSYRVDEAERWLTDAGLVDPKTVFLGGFQLVSASRRS